MLPEAKAKMFHLQPTLPPSRPLSHHDSSWRFMVEKWFEMLRLNSLRFVISAKTHKTGRASNQTIDFLPVRHSSCDEIDSALKPSATRDKYINADQLLVLSSNEEVEADLSII